MIRRRDDPVYECIVVDLNTQFDYCDVNGAFPVANVVELIPALRRAVAWAKRNATPVISSIESHRQTEVTDSPSRCCCVDGTGGQRKVDFTLFHPSASIEVDNTLCCPVDLFKDHQQVIFRKRTDDLLSNPKADRFFTQLPAREFILFGVGIERAIKSLALGLLAREKRVTILVDASGYWDRATADQALQQMVAKGARTMTVCELRLRKLNRSWRYQWKVNRPRRGAGHNGRHHGNGRDHGNDSVARS